MKETTKDIIRAYCENARQNALKLGAVQSVKFTVKGIIVGGEAVIADEKQVSFFDFTEVSGGFTLEQIVRMLRSVSKSAEGTTVVFVHSFKQKIVEQLASVCGFRTYEHFSVTRVVKELCGETEGIELSYCMAVKKPSGFCS